MNEEKVAAELVKIAKELTSTTSLTIAYPIGNGYDKLVRLDESFVGSPNYMGIAYFWNSSYKHGLRKADAMKRKQVHDALLKAGLDLSGESEKHDEIMKRLKVL